jgi:hypothetical protein
LSPVSTTWQLLSREFIGAKQYLLFSSLFLFANPLFNFKLSFYIVSATRFIRRFLHTGFHLPTYLSLSRNRCEANTFLGMDSAVRLSSSVLHSHSSKSHISKTCVKSNIFLESQDETKFEEMLYSKGFRCSGWAG